MIIGLVRALSNWQLFEYLLKYIFILIIYVIKPRPDPAFVVQRFDEKKEKEKKNSGSKYSGPLDPPSFPSPNL